MFCFGKFAQKTFQKCVWLFDIPKFLSVAKSFQNQIFTTYKNNSLFLEQCLQDSNVKWTLSKLLCIYDYDGVYGNNFVLDTVFPYLPNSSDSE